MRIIRLKEVIESTGLARSTVYKFISDGVFPKPISLGDRCVGWLVGWRVRFKTGFWVRSKNVILV
jgi:prophage regulatory protein